MAHLDPLLGAKGCKSSTSDKLEIFRTIFGISCKFLTKNYLHEIALFSFVVKGYLMQYKSGQRGEESMICAKMFFITAK